MEQNKKRDILTQIIITAVVLIGSIFLEKKLKEHQLRMPTIGEYLAFGFAFSILAWICIGIVAIVKWVIHLF